MFGGTQGSHLKPKELNYQQKGMGERGARDERRFRTTAAVRNPIKVVMDMMGEDGLIHQKIVSQEQPNYNARTRLNQFRNTRLDQYRSTRSMPKIDKYEPTPVSATGHQSTRPDKLARSFVFNRFSYDNYQQFPIPKTRNSMLTRSRKALSTNPGSHKNIEVVFCENKLTDFVQKTNQQVEEAYQEQQRQQAQQNQLQTQHSKQLLRSSMELNPASERASRRPSKTSLSSCLKQFATLQKLSLFMESDQQRREKCMCYQLQKDPSRTLLLDIITHRFTFLKTLPTRARSHIYRSLLNRQINTLSKINVQEYMLISQMFIGRDAGVHSIAVFMYLFMFGQEGEVSFERGRERLEMINGQTHRLRILLQQLDGVMSSVELQLLVDGLAKRQKLLRLFIDYIIQRQ